MSAIDDLLGIEESWEDILQTANQLETLILDGLEWLENHPDEIKSGFKSIQEEVSKLDFSNPLPKELIANATNLLKDTLDPALDKLYEMGEEVTPGSVLGLLEDHLSSMQGLPNELKDLGGQFKGLVDEIRHTKPTVKLMDLPPHIIDASTKSNSNHPSKDSGLKANLASSDWDGSDHKANANSNSIFESASSEFESSIKKFFNNNMPIIDALIDKVSKKLPPKLMGFLENDKDEGIGNLNVQKLLPPGLLQFDPSSEKLTMEDLLSSIEATYQMNGKQIQSYISDFFLLDIEDEIVTSLKLVKEFLFTPIEVEPTVKELWESLTGKTQIAILDLASFVVSVPLVVLCRTFDVDAGSFKSSIFQSQASRRYIYGSCQLADGIITAFGALQVFFPSYLSANISLAIVNALTYCTGLVEQSSLPPESTSSSLEKSIWYFQFAIVGWKAISCLIYLGTWPKENFKNEVGIYCTDAKIKIEDFQKGLERLHALPQGGDLAKQMDHCCTNLDSLRFYNQSKYGVSLDGIEAVRAHLDQIQLLTNGMNPATLNGFDVAALIDQLGVFYKEQLSIERGDKICTGLNVVLEIVHLAMFDQLFKEQKDSPNPDSRIKDCYYIDPLSGFLGGLCNLICYFKSGIYMKQFWSVVEAIVDVSFQSAYGGLYIDTEVRPSAQASPATTSQDSSETTSQDSSESPPPQ